MQFMAVTDDNHSIEDLATIIHSIIHQVDFVQIREKSKSAQQVLTLLDELEEHGVEKEKLIINDRVDIALLKEIPTVHLPEHGIPVKTVKKQYPSLRVGCSVHTVGRAKEVELEGADYVVYGHCFETNSKKGIPSNGMEPLIQMKKELRIPVIGIGGITLEKVPIMKEANADGIAVMSSIFQAPDPGKMARQFQEALIPV